jgi:hypothetical protein
MRELSLSYGSVSLFGFEWTEVERYVKLTVVNGLERGRRPQCLQASQLFFGSKSPPVQILQNPLSYPTTVTTQLHTKRLFLPAHFCSTFVS